MKVLRLSLLVAGILLTAIAPAHGVLQQSPINLPYGMPITNNLPAVDFANYAPAVPAGIKVKNEGSDDADAAEKSMKILINGVRSVTLDGTVYKLQNIHFHKHSEHKLDGSYMDMEMHMVHQSDAGANLAIGRWIKQGNVANAALTEVFQNFPNNHLEYTTVNPLDVAALIPPAAKRKSWRYEGSLTTPHIGSLVPVSWVMYHEPLELSAAQINAFAAKFPNNWRGLQDTMEIHGLVSDVPEPAAAVLLTVAGLVVTMRRRRAAA